MPDTQSVETRMLSTTPDEEQQRLFQVLSEVVMTAQQRMPLEFLLAVFANMAGSIACCITSLSEKEIEDMVTMNFQQGHEEQAAARRKLAS